MCYGKEIGFGSQSMKIAEASSRAKPRLFEIVVEIERCFRYHAFPQDRTAIKAGKGRILQGGSGKAHS